MLGLREAQLESSGLDERTFSLVQITALIALDAPLGLSLPEVSEE